jgi:hypothetical protein
VSDLISGIDGTGEVVTYTLTPDQAFSLDLLCFQLTTDGTAGVHRPEVLIRAQNGDLVARIPDWNDAPGSATVTYTFGRGLAAFCGSVIDGQSVQNDLPFTDLDSQCSITLRSVDPTGAVIAGDAFSNVSLWVTEADSGGPESDVIPPYTSLAYADQVGPVPV